MLQGTLETLSFAEVILLAARKSVTGSLQVKTAKGRTVVHLHEGQIVGIDSEDAASGGFRRKVEDVIAHLLTIERGSFELRPTVHTVEGEDGIDVKTALAGARRLLSEWREVESAIPSLDARPRVVANLDSQGVTLSRDQWRILQTIDGHRSVRALARVLAVSQPEVARGLRSLLEAGAIQFESPSTVAVPLPGQAVHNGFDPDDTRATIVISRSRARARSRAEIAPDFVAPEVDDLTSNPSERRRSFPGLGRLRRRRSGSEPAAAGSDAWPQTG